AGERAVGGPLEPLHGRIALAHPFERGLDILYLEAEMVEAGRTPGAARIDVEADIAVTHRNRLGGADERRVPHAEHSLIEFAELGVIVAADGDVVDLGKHGALPCERGVSLPGRSAVAPGLVPPI